jgi:flagellar export protein FliJ
MKRYQFRLEGVLRLRRAELEQARLVLAGANAALQSALLVREREAERYNSVAFRSDASAPDALRAELHDSAVAHARLAGAERSVADAAVHAAVAQVNWSSANRRVAALERLDERRRAEHAAEVRREEAVLLDEIAGARYLRAHNDRPAAS